jgi:dCMP deaminase
MVNFDDAVAVDTDKWDIRFLGLAKIIAGWSKDPSTQVGAVIVDCQRRVVSLGYNGIPRRVYDDPQRLENREMKYKFIVHAEANAILQASKGVEGCKMYVWPFPPCNECAKLIIQSGIKSVICPASEPSRWKDSCAIARQMFIEANVDLIMVDGKDCGNGE